MTSFVIQPNAQLFRLLLRDLARSELAVTGVNKRLEQECDAKARAALAKLSWSGHVDVQPLSLERIPVNVVAAI
jgi:hypothetical protein